jgi:hypothetical protein
MDGKPSYGNTISIGGDNNGMAAIGEQIFQMGGQAGSSAGQAEELKVLLGKLEPLLAQFEQDISKEAPPEKQDMAREMAGELKQTLMSGKPDLDTLGFVKAWFGRNAPKLAGTVTGIIVHPIVGRLVEAAGEMLANEFRRRFGQQGV